MATRWRSADPPPLERAGGVSGGVVFIEVLIFRLGLLALVHGLFHRRLLLRRHVARRFLGEGAGVGGGHGGLALLLLTGEIEIDRRGIAETRPDVAGRHRVNHFAADFDRDVVSAERQTGVYELALL